MRPDDLLAALWASAGWVAVVVAAHFTVFHLVQVERRARTLVSLWGLGLMGYLWTGLVLDLDRWRIVYGTMTLGCAFTLYMPFYYTLAASQSVQMLIDIAREPDGLTVTELRLRYPTDEILEGRLATLVVSGYLAPQGRRVVLTPKARLVTRPFSLVKALWRLGPGG